MCKYLMEQFTHVGLLHCLSLYLTPPPQALLHELYGPNSLHPPFTGVTVLLPLMHCPRTQICQTDNHSLACNIFIKACIHWWTHSLYHQQVEDYWFYTLLHLTVAYTTNGNIFPNRNNYTHTHVQSNALQSSYKYGWMLSKNITITMIIVICEHSVFTEN